MVIDNNIPPRASAPPASPILADVSGTEEHQQKPVTIISAPVPNPNPSSATYTNVMDTEGVLLKAVPSQPMVSAAQNRSTNTSLHGQCCSSETARPSSSMINADGKPTTGSSLWTEKARLSGAGPKKRRGGAAGGARKRGKADLYDDVDTLLSDIKSPIFKETANIKGVLLHPQTKEAVTGEGEGEIYAFEYMTSEELATTAAAFRIDGAYGRYDVDWLRQALEASALRTAGAFDEHDAEQFEKDWAEEDEGVSDEEVEKNKEESESMGDVEVEKNTEESESMGEGVEKINSPMDKDAGPMEEHMEQPDTAQMQ